jgi:hypothetical protein
MAIAGQIILGDRDLEIMLMLLDLIASDRELTQAREKHCSTKQKHRREIY